MLKALEISHHSKAISQVKQLGYWLGFGILSIYSAHLLSGLFALPYTNPYHIIGLASLNGVNPLSNFSSLGSTIVLSLLFFGIFHMLFQRKDFVRLRFLFIIFLTLTFFVGSTTFYKEKFQALDLFHDGEQLGVASAVAFFHKQPFSDLFFLHGAFADPLVATMAFRLFGPSIGSSFLFQLLLELVTLITLLIILHKIIRSNVIYFLGTTFIFLTLEPRLFFRELLPFLFIFTIAQLRPLPSTKGRMLIYVLLGIMTSISFFIYVDRGFYLLLTSFLLIPIMNYFACFDYNNLTKYLPWKNWFIATIRQYFFFLCGACLPIISWLFCWGRQSLAAFFQITFVVLPRMKPFLDEYTYPPLSMATFFSHYLALLLIILNGIVFFYTLLPLARRKKFSYILPLTTWIMSVLFLRSGVGRNDATHMAYIATYIYISWVILIDHIYRITSTSLVKFTSVTILIIFLLLPQNRYQRFLELEPLSKASIRIFFNLPTINDDFWMSTEAQHVTQFIKDKTTIDDPIFVFTNESAYYYSTQRQNPTRFYTAWFAAPDIFQREVVAKLIQQSPKYILYQSSNWPNSIDGIFNAQKLPLIDTWIRANYPVQTVIDSMIILSK